MTIPAGAQFPNLMPALLARGKSPLLFIYYFFLMISELKKETVGNM